MHKGKSNKQEEIFEFIKSQLIDKGYPPTVREIGAHVGLKSTSTVHGHLSRLEKKGLIKRDPSKPRAIVLVGASRSKTEMIDIPIVGKVTAGEPILAVENIEDTFSLPISYIKNSNPLFGLNIRGESMINAGINNGDMAIIEKVNSAQNGDIVVAMIDNEATIKRFFKEEDHIRLQPENDNMEPIIVKNCSILGKLVGLYRKY
ncbi:transcriptional repressor LexA [Clostridium sediminicola]|uniref:transcriptional repressor LexA n=1 Tax=Clostridium sediminicola TaxID=3114879 RepID=UPI0031F25C96